MRNFKHLPPPPPVKSGFAVSALLSLFALVLCFGFQACVPEMDEPLDLDLNGNDSSKESMSFKPKLIKFAEAKSFLNQVIQKESSFLRTDGENFTTVFGEIDNQFVVEVLQKDKTSKRFTFKVKSVDDEGKRFYNLIIDRSPSGNLTAWILEFESESKFNFIQGKMNMNTFNGLQRKYRLNGDLLQEVYLKNGQPSAAPFGRTENESLCAIGYEWNVDQECYTLILGGEGSSFPEEEFQNCIDVWTYEQIMGQCNDGGNNGGGLEDPGSGGGGDTGIVPPTEEELWLSKIDYNGLNACLKAIMDQLLQLHSTEIANILRYFTDDLAKFDWKLEMGTIPGDKNAITNMGTSNGSIVSVFDMSKISNASALSIARTIIHEAIHAFLVDIYKNDPLLANSNFFILADDFKVSPNNAHHNLFSSTFANEIGNALFNFAQTKGLNNVTLAYSHDLAWGGLTHDDSGNLASWFTNSITDPTDRARILDVISIEQAGVDMNANPQNQFGGANGC
jgi:antitoxin component YwqK of YwqJK toxin-antitoxin module